MGASGAGSFQNDSAWDWLAELDGPASLAAAFDAVLSEDVEYVDFDESAGAIAAAEVVAAVNGHPAKNLPEEIDDFLATHAPEPSERLTRRALEALARVEADSELQGLWDEGEVGAEWHAAVAELRTRLQATPMGVVKKLRLPRKKPEIRVVAKGTSPDGRWTSFLTETLGVDEPHTGVVIENASWGSGVCAAMGIDLGLEARWTSPRTLELALPPGLELFQRETRVQQFEDVVTITYRERGA